MQAAFLMDLIPINVSNYCRNFLFKIILSNLRAEFDMARWQTRNQSLAFGIS